MTKFIPGPDIDNLCGTPTVWPSTEMVVFVQKINDSYLHKPRGVLSGGTISSSYDAYSNLELLFATQNETPEAVVVLDRDQLESDADNADDGDGIDQAPARLRFITTHPEFGYVNLSDGFAANYPRRLLTAQADRGDTLSLGSYSPAIFERRRPEPEGTKWLLVVPSTCVSVDPTAIDDISDSMYHPGWSALPEFAPWFKFGLLSIFDISDPSAITDTQSPALPAEYRVAPDVDSALFNVDILALHEENDPEDLSDNEYYAFVTDFGGRLYVFDLTGSAPDVMNPPVVSGAPFASWTPQDSVSDLESPNNVWDVILDVDATGIYVYLSVLRHGIVVLKFDPTAPLAEDRLIHQELIQTGYRSSGMFLRKKNGVPTLVVADHGAGIRLYKKP